MPERYIEVQRSEGKPAIIRLEPKVPVVIWMRTDQMQPGAPIPQQNLSPLFGRPAVKSKIEVRSDNSFRIKTTPGDIVVFMENGRFRDDIPVFMQDDTSINSSPKKAVIKYGDPPKS